MENRVNRYSVCHVSFECEGQMNLFLVHYGAGIMLKKRFFKNFFFCPVVWGLKKAHPSTPNEKKHSLLTFKHFLFYFHDIFFPIFFPDVTTKYRKNVFF